MTAAGTTERLLLPAGVFVLPGAFMPSLQRLDEFDKPKEHGVL